MTLKVLMKMCIRDRHITYKLNKFVNPTLIDYTYSPVEGMVTPYSADLLKVYNNEVDTCLLYTSRCV